MMMTKQREMAVHPIGLSRLGDDSIEFNWSDGRIDQWTAMELRKACPCATCREKKRGEEQKLTMPGSAMLLPVLSRAEAAPLRIEAMDPVGGYAYRVRFSDGHASGIYPFDLLRK
jgi:DUF971 family protein